MMMFNRFVWPVLILEASAVAGGPPAAGAIEANSQAPSWTVSLQAGYTNTYQMLLGGFFGEGPYLQGRLTVSANNLLGKGDTLSLFGWSATDLPNRAVDWQTGLGYKRRLFRRHGQTLSLAGGAQRWILPNVKTGAQDWLLAGTLGYTTSFKRLPITVTEDSLSLLRSTLPTGSLLSSQIQTQHTLLKHEGLKLFLRHGVSHTYSWNFYGANGNRVVRYGASAVVAWKETSLEFGCRQQFALQDKIRYNRYWTFLLTRQLTRPFHPEPRLHRTAD